MKKAAIILIASVLALTACSKGKDPMLFWLVGLQQDANSSGGNEGLPASSTTADPPPVVTPTGTDEACAPLNPPPSPSVQDILNQQPLTGDGTSTSPDIFVEKGVIVGNLNCGKLTRQDGSKVQVVSNGAAPGSIVIKDIGGNAVNGTLQIIGDDFVFVPAVRLTASKVYTITFTLTGGVVFTEQIFMAVDNTCMADSLFERATVYGADASPLIKDSAIMDNNGVVRSISGWDFSKGRFYMTLANKTSGAKYVLTLYGVYNIDGHHCEVYFQRFATSPYNAVENINITNSGTMHVDETDSSVPNPAGGYYSFSKTYIQLKVYDAANNDITATDTAVLQLQKADQKVAMMDRSTKALASAPVFEDNRSALAAFLGRSGGSAIVLILVLVVGMAGIAAALIHRRKAARASKPGS